jgi:hypothetical protein
MCCVGRSLVAALFVLSVSTAAQAQTTGQAPNRTRVSFTFATSLLAGGLGGDESMTMDEYVYFPDPLHRGLTMAGVLLHLKEFDHTKASYAAAERFAVLVGGVITPTGGIGFGGSYMVARPLWLNAGVAILFVNTAKDGKLVLEVPNDLASPLKTGVAYGFFIGANYTFGR